jgi:hypothetical protein
VAADPVVVLALAGRMCGIDVRCKSSGHGTDDTADHHGRQFDVQSWAVRSRSRMFDDAGQVRRPVPRRGAGRVT